MIDRLEFLIALASERHFSRAARACGVTQATLSAGLKQLEGMFGVMLVQRGARFVGFTDEGEKALEWARQVVAAVRGMRQDVEGPQGRSRGQDSHRRDPDRARHGLLADDAVPRAESRCPLYRPLPHVGRSARAA